MGIQNVRLNDGSIIKVFKPKQGRVRGSGDAMEVMNKLMKAKAENTNTHPYLPLEDGDAES